MQRLDRVYITVGLLWVIVGMIFGTWLGATNHLNYANSHAHINLLGFVTSVLFGILYWAYPALRKSRIAIWQFVIYEAGIALLILGKFMFDTDQIENVFLKLGSVITIIGTVMMLYMFSMVRADGTSRT